MLLQAIHPGARSAGLVAIDGSLGLLLDLLGSVQRDSAIVQCVLEIVGDSLFGVSSSDTKSAAGAAVDQVLRDARHLGAVLEVLDTNDMWTRLLAIQVLAALFRANPTAANAALLSCSAGLRRLVGVLDDPSEETRNEALLLLVRVTETSEEARSVVAFEEGFDKLFRLAFAALSPPPLQRDEDDDDDGADRPAPVIRSDLLVTASDCLTIAVNVLRGGNVTRKLFLQSIGPRLFSPVLRASLRALVNDSGSSSTTPALCVARLAVDVVAETLSGVAVPPTRGNITDSSLPNASTAASASSASAAQNVLAAAPGLIEALAEAAFVGSSTQPATAAALAPLRVSALRALATLIACCDTAASRLETVVLSAPCVHSDNEGDSDAGVCLATTAAARVATRCTGATAAGAEERDAAAAVLYSLLGTGSTADAVSRRVAFIGHANAAPPVPLPLRLLPDYRIAGGRGTTESGDTLSDEFVTPRPPGQVVFAALINSVDMVVGAASRVAGSGNAVSAHLESLHTSSTLFASVLGDAGSDSDRSAAAEMAMRLTVGKLRDVDSSGSNATQSGTSSLALLPSDSLLTVLARASIALCTAAAALPSINNSGSRAGNAVSPTQLPLAAAALFPVLRVLSLWLACCPPAARAFVADAANLGIMDVASMSTASVSSAAQAIPPAVVASGTACFLLGATLVGLGDGARQTASTSQRKAVNHVQSPSAAGTDDPLLLSSAPALLAVLASRVGVARLGACSAALLSSPLFACAARGRPLAISLSAVAGQGRPLFLVDTSLVTTLSSLTSATARAIVAVYTSGSSASVSESGDPSVEPFKDLIRLQDTQLRAAEAEIEALRADLRELRRLNGSADGYASHVVPDERSDIETAITECHARVAELEATVTALNAELAARASATASAEALAQAAERFASLEAAYHNDIGSWRSAYEQQAARITELEASAVQPSAHESHDVVAFQSLVAAAEAARATAEAALVDANRRVDAYHAQLLEVHAVYRSNDAARDDAERVRAAESQTTIAELERERDTLAATIAEMRGAIAALSTSLTVANSRADAAEVAINALRTQVSVAEAAATGDAATLSAQATALAAAREREVAHDIAYAALQRELVAARRAETEASSAAAVSRREANEMREAIASARNAERAASHARDLISSEHEDLLVLLALRDEEKVMLEDALARRGAYDELRRVRDFAEMALNDMATADDVNVELGAARASPAVGSTPHTVRSAAAYLRSALRHGVDEVMDRKASSGIKNVGANPASHEPESASTMSVNAASGAATSYFGPSYESSHSNASPHASMLIAPLSGSDLSLSPDNPHATSYANDAPYSQATQAVHLFASTARGLSFEDDAPPQEQGGHGASNSNAVKAMVVFGDLPAPRLPIQQLQPTSLHRHVHWAAESAPTALHSDQIVHTSAVPTENSAESVLGNSQTTEASMPHTRTSRTHGVTNSVSTFFADAMHALSATVAPLAARAARAPNENGDAVEEALLADYASSAWGGENLEKPAQSQIYVPDSDVNNDVRNGESKQAFDVHEYTSSTSGVAQLITNRAPWLSHGMDTGGMSATATNVSSWFSGSEPAKADELPTWSASVEPVAEAPAYFDANGDGQQLAAVQDNSGNNTHAYGDTVPVVASISDDVAAVDAWAEGQKGSLPLQASRGDREDTIATAPPTLVTDVDERQQFVDVELTPLGAPERQLRGGTIETITRPLSAQIAHALPSFLRRIPFAAAAAAAQQYALSSVPAAQSEGEGSHEHQSTRNDSSSGSTQSNAASAGKLFHYFASGDLTHQSQSKDSQQYADDTNGNGTDRMLRLAYHTEASAPASVGHIFPRLLHGLTATLIGSEDDTDSASARNDISTRISSDTVGGSRDDIRVYHEDEAAQVDVSCSTASASESSAWQTPAHATSSAREHVTNGNFSVAPVIDPGTTDASLRLGETQIVASGPAPAPPLAFAWEASTMHHHQFPGGQQDAAESTSAQLPPINSRGVPPIAFAWDTTSNQGTHVQHLGSAVVHSSTEGLSMPVDAQPAPAAAMQLSHFQHQHMRDVDPRATEQPLSARSLTPATTMPSPSAFFGVPAADETYSASTAPDNDRNSGEARALAPPPMHWSGGTASAPVPPAVLSADAYFNTAAVGSGVSIASMGPPPTMQSQQMYMSPWQRMQAAQKQPRPTNPPPPTWFG